MHTPGKLSAVKLQVIMSHLADGEQLCWAGQEPLGRYWLRHTLRLVEFALGCLLAGFLTLAWVARHPDFFHHSYATILTGLCLLLLAALGAFLLGREIARMLKSHVDLYALTSRRARVISSGGQVKAWPFGSLPCHPAKVRRRGNSGDIIFVQHAGWSTDAAGRPTHQRLVVGFYGLPNVDEVLRWLSTPQSQGDRMPLKR